MDVHRSTPTVPAPEMTARGSEPEGQEFFANGAKPPCGFRDRGSALLMATCGWISAVNHTVTPDLI